MWWALFGVTAWVLAKTNKNDLSYRGRLMSQQILNIHHVTKMGHLVALKH